MVERVGTLGKSQSTIGWTDGPVSSSVRRIAEMKSRKRRRRMNRRSIGGHRRSIRWFACTRQRGSGATTSSTGWTDGPGISSSDGYEIQDNKLLVVGSSALDEPTHRRIHRRVKCQMNCVSRLATTTWHGAPSSFVKAASRWPRELGECLSG
jgi:hypothetical protein